jgi:hypothetical protein
MDVELIRLEELKVALASPEFTLPPLSALPPFPPLPPDPPPLPCPEPACCELVEPAEGLCDAGGGTFTLVLPATVLLGVFESPALLEAGVEPREIGSMAGRTELEFTREMLPGVLTGGTFTTSARAESGVVKTTPSARAIEGRARSRL